MDVDLTKLDENVAEQLAVQLLTQFEDARQEMDRQERRAAGIRKMIDGLIELFPAVEDLLPEDFEDDREPRPRGAEAVRRVLEEHKGSWFLVGAIVQMLAQRDWLPNSTKPANAVRTALERLVESATIEKSRTDGGAVIYMFPNPPAYDEEPF